MDKRRARSQGGGGSADKLVWKTSAVVSNDSKEFAEALEKVLNERSAEGYVLAQMLPRQTDNGIVLVHQKYVVADGYEPESGAN